MFGIQCNSNDKMELGASLCIKVRKPNINRSGKASHYTKLQDKIKLGLFLSSNLLS